jgi:hypothetical protein
MIREEKINHQILILFVIIAKKTHLEEMLRRHMSLGLSLMISLLNYIAVHHPSLGTPVAMSRGMARLGTASIGRENKEEFNNAN